MANIQNSIMIYNLNEYVERLKMQSANFLPGDDQSALTDMIAQINSKLLELEHSPVRRHFSKSDNSVVFRNVLKRIWKYEKEAKHAARLILRQPGANPALVESLVTEATRNYETLVQSFKYERESSLDLTIPTIQALKAMESLKQILFTLTSQSKKGDIQELRRLTREALSLGPDEDAATEVELRRKIATLDQKDPITQDLKSILGMAREFTQVKVHPKTRELLSQLNTPGFGNPFFTFVAASPKYVMTANNAYRYQSPVVVAKLIYDLLDIPAGPRDVVFQSADPNVPQILESINKNFQKLHREIEELKPKSFAKTLGVNENARRLLAAAPPPKKSDLFDEKLEDLQTNFVLPLIEARMQFKQAGSTIKSHHIDALVESLETHMRGLRRHSTAPEIKEYETAIKSAEKYRKTDFVSRKWKHGNAGGRRTLKKNVR